jgi:hypothetical protein
MDKKFRYLVLLISVLLALSLQSASAQEQGSFYFPESGHYVTGEFHDFYFANPEARLLYGFPITEAYIDAKTGNLVQYFENVRFEYIAANPPGNRVQITALGQQLYEHGTYIISLSQTTPGCHQHADWDYPVCFSFHQFYDQYGGQAQFGRPVSGLEYLRGRLVQFFEYAQLVWMPENEAQAEIVVAQLGLKYFFAHETNLSKLDPIRNFSYHLNISDIHVTAFVKDAVIGNGSSQVIDVIAVDQNQAPLTKGIVQVTFRYPDGRETISNPMATDDLGLLNFVAYPVQSEILGPVEVIVRLTYNDLEAIAVTSFRIWY